MATTHRVHTSREAPSELGAVLDRFRSEGVGAAPTNFGSHRRPEAAVIPYSLYERLESLLEDDYLGRLAEERVREETSISGDQAARLMRVDAADLRDVGSVIRAELDVCLRAVRALGRD